MKNLLELQQKFNDHIFDKSDKEILKILPYNSIEALARLNIYRNNVVGNIESVLESIYEVTKEILGQKKFEKLAFEFAKKFPSKSGNLNEFGKKFPDFISTQKPYFKDLAQFELILHESFFAKEIEKPFDLIKFKKLPPEKFSNLIFSLHPSCVFFTSKFAVFSIWQKRKEIKNFSKAESAIIFSSKALQLNAEELLFLAAIKKRKKLYQIYETLCKKTGKEFDIGALMNHFISNGIIINYE